MQLEDDEGCLVSSEYMLPLRFDESISIVRMVELIGTTRGASDGLAGGFLVGVRSWVDNVSIGWKRIIGGHDIMCCGLL